MTKVPLRIYSTSEVDLLGYKSVKVSRKFELVRIRSII